MKSPDIHYTTEYKDYSTYTAIMISTDRKIFDEESSVHKRMILQSKMYKELHIIVFSTEHSSVLEIAPNVHVYGTGSQSRLMYMFNAYKIAQKILTPHTNSPLLITCQDPFETGLVGAYIASRHEKSELLLQIHTDLYSKYFTRHSPLNFIRVLISEITLPHANIIRVVSRKIADSLTFRGYDSEKIVLKPIDVSVDALVNTEPSFNLRAKFPQFKKIVLVVSRLEAEKNIIGAIKAFNLVQKEVEGLGLVIVGSGRKMRSLKALVRKLDITHKVIFAGWQNDMVSYYKGCDVVLVTSWYEGYGMIFKEASALSVPVVSTDVGIARDSNARITGHSIPSIARGLLAVVK